jgi:hypothetical protein
MITENVLQVPLGSTVSASAFVNQVHSIAGVKEISLSRSAPISDDHGGIRLVKMKQVNDKVYALFMAMKISFLFMEFN